MSEAADAADAFGHIDILLEVSGLDQLFQPAVHEADIGDGFDDDFIFQDQIEMDRLWQGRVLRAKGNGAAFCHHFTPFCANGVSVSMRYNLCL